MDVVGTPLISSGLITSSCTANGDGISGSSTASGLTISDAPVTLNGTANQVLFDSVLPGTADFVRIVANEQTPAVDPNTPGVNRITVNALHFTLTNAGATWEVVVATSVCAVTGPDVNRPLAVTLRFFGARASRSGVRLGWRLASQNELLGFNVLRQQQGRRLRLNRRLIPAKAGARYLFLDRTVRGSRAAGASYWLEAVNLDGSRSRYGPARVR